MIALNRLTAPGLFVLALVLSGCGTTDQELQDWMAEQRNQSRSKVDRLPEPSKFLPQAYTQEALEDPFSNQKLVLAFKGDAHQSTMNTAQIAPELARRKEPLEASPLDALNMVGSLTKAGQLVALVRADKLLYQVRVGNYLGQNYGRVTKVTDSGLSLRELVQDQAGEWIERTATLSLLEVSK